MAAQLDDGNKLNPLAGVQAPQPQAAKGPSDTAQELYVVNGQYVDANGNPVKMPVHLAANGYGGTMTDAPLDYGVTPEGRHADASGSIQYGEYRSWRRNEDGSELMIWGDADLVSDPDKASLGAADGAATNPDGAVDPRAAELHDLASPGFRCGDEATSRRGTKGPTPTTSSYTARVVGSGQEFSWAASCTMQAPASLMAWRVPGTW